ncbi:tetratricopeptide repeat protein [Alienimonas sp. DA493]|uniref:tetratricopeptide repeat protein n=1 Tax=Alienimonas sp. DA493 TaxID=3373605 RepID=UPI003754B11F
MSVRGVLFLTACAAALAAAGCRSAAPSASDLASALMTPGGSVPAADLTEAQRTDVRLSLARSMEAAGEWNAAAEAYEATLAADPEHAHALHRLAVVRCRQGRPGEAAELFERALKAKPGDPDLFADVGYLDLLRGDLPAAERNLRQALALDPAHAAARGNLGATLARLGETEEALACLKAAGAGSAAESDLAFALAAGGRPREARRALERAPEPTNEAARARRRTLLAALAGSDAGGGVVPASTEEARAEVARGEAAE